MTQIYDQNGDGYSNLRNSDPPIAKSILHALGEAETLVNVGAGAGSYEPSDRQVVAAEPSLTMIRQRRLGIAPVVQASALDLPFRDGAFAAALAVLTVHHRPDRARGLHELGRVARNRVVIFTWDPASSGFWLIDDYFPEIGVIDRQILPPTGGGPMNIWILEYAARYRPSPRSTMWNPAWSGCGGNWKMALGSTDTDIC